MDKNILKSISKVVVLSVGLLLSSCSYEDFVSDFDYTAVYLPYASIERSFIMGEGMQVGVGVVLSGTLSSTEDVEVTFSLDEALVVNRTVLPTTHYKLVNIDGKPTDNKIIIPAGKTQGFVYVKADSISFLEDPLSSDHNYALGFHLDNVVNADSILVDFESTVISFTYVNQLFGNYFHTGQLIKNAGELDEETIKYSGGVTDLDAFKLTMISPNTVQCNGIADLRGADKIMNIVIAEDNTITIETAIGGVTIIDDGGSFYNPTDRQVTLNYSFESNGVTYKSNDVLKFRNRVIDGVNQIGI